MTVSRPPVLRIGDEVRLRGQVHVVDGLAEGQVRLLDVAGGAVVVPLSRLLTDPTFRIVSAVPPAPLPPAGLLDGLPDEAVEQARWWERHIVEVLTGRPPGAEKGARGRPEFDPETHTLRQRELAKVAELAGQGEQVSFKTLQRLRRGYEREGLWALVDRRFARLSSPTGRADERVIAAMVTAIEEQTHQSTGTATRVRRRSQQILAAEYGPDAPPMPPERTFYRLFASLSAGRHTIGSARTRQSVAKRPDRPFGTVTAFRPGEWTQIDSTPLNVRVVLDTGETDRVELTWMIDLATRTIPAAVLRPTTKAADAAVLLAKAMTPEPMRPGWVDALRMSRSVLPHRRLTELDERLEHAAARPVIVPETIVCDHGKAYISRTFQNACRAMGINFQPAHKGSPWEKGNVERSFDSVDTLFAQYVAGYVGSSVEHRGRHAERDAVWSMAELQALLDEWIVAVWQNRPHAGLRDPVTPDKALTPNEQYAALIEISGYAAVPLAGDDYIELLPVSWNAIGKEGVKLRRRTYDDKALVPLRGQPSGVASKKNLWEVRYDPYDISRVWVRNHWDGGWILVPWKHLRSTPAPFGELAWQHARRILAERGQDAATEAEIAQAAAALLDTAEQGPAEKTTKKDRKVAGRTRATAATALPCPAPVAPDTDADDEPEPDEDLAPVIPLPVFDAREEAKRWW
ncbi:Mu transposase C-terminal domain-containing protein [Micromonospora sp. FIMYZ51]|uniref:Mu transposase C-terminal domain-containing protein n=1 Tax=Micromonospora sp. FIMYZ51 TaxID=3051832 RepID=UPI00311E3B0D